MILQIESQSNECVFALPIGATLKFTIQTVAVKSAKSGAYLIRAIAKINEVIGA